MSTAVIIGAGLAGLSSARALQKRGWQVTVVDKNPAPALGTSFANAGMLTPSMADPWNNPQLLPYLLKHLGQESSSFLLRAGGLSSSTAWSLRFLQHSNQRDHQHACEANFKLARFSLQQLQQWQQEIGISFQQRRHGTMKLFRQARDRQTSETIAEQLSPLGLSYHALSPSEAVAQEPALAPIQSQLDSAIWYPHDASGNAYLFCQALAQQLSKDGAKLCYDQHFKRWRRRGSQLVGLSTNKADYDADAIVIAAGCDSPSLLRPLDLELMVRPIKGYSLSINCPQQDGLPKLPIIDEALHGAITPFDSLLRIAGTAEIAGFDLTKKRQRLDNLRQLLQQMLPAAAPTLLNNEQTEWAGLRPMSADGLPYIGGLETAAKQQRLYLNTGHGHLGWTHSAGSAELLAAQMDGEKTAIDDQPYRATRVLKRA